MLLTYFTEQAMSAYPADKGLEHGYTVLNFSNEHFDPQAGSRLYNEYLHQYKLAEQVGYDAIMLNEHHNAPFCMQARIGVFASILAAVTDRVKIVTLGIPLPLSDNPVALAEEFGMIDMISKGRLVSGIVRGGGTEQLAHNANPAYNRERFEEAHDLIIKAWTTPGPFRWEGDHYQFRVVNPWVRPMQTPHPRIFVPGVSSNETIEWAAAHRYPYIGLGTDPRTQKRIMDIYEATAHAHGYEPGSENYGQLLRVHVQDTEEKAERLSHHFTWMQGEFTGLAHPVWSAPSGYLAAARRRRVVEQVNSRSAKPSPISRTAKGIATADAAWKSQVENMQIIYGTPKQVIEKLKTVLRQTRPGVFGMWSVDGSMPFEDGNRCIQLMGGEVLPAIREFAQEEGIKSPFEAEAPISLAYSPGAAASPKLSLGG
jgi:alkanesulfonate monooxygenase SsuD/methylene tetrahydromethanopterin reductase-like flavin-dependent oxidoreductase (luciferase family)